jgi:Beta-lactamase enzyme family
MSSNRPGNANSAHPRHFGRSRRNRSRRNLVIMLVLSAVPLLCATPAAPALAMASRPTSPASPSAMALTPPVTIPAAAPATTALQQLEWLIDASARPPISTAELDQHLTPQLLVAAGGPAGFNQALESVGKLSVQQLLLNQPAHVEAVTVSANGVFFADLRTDASGLISGLGLAPYVASPHTWQQLDTRLRALAPEVSFAAMTIGPGGGCHVVHGINAGTARPLGSAFKLYVLGALGQAVASHHASWDEQLAIHEQWKSLPSGVLQNEPPGTELTLRQYADYMISISDNTAADHLIHFLGRGAVQAQLFRFGMQDPGRDIPFLTTRELFALKSVRYPALADSYLALPPRLRAAALPGLDRIPLSQLHGWTQPELINQLEWFASPTDICRAYAGLWRENAQPGMGAIGDALAINDGGIGLDRTTYPLVWFKGGSEPGVLTVNYLARTSAGQLLVSSLMLASPDSALDEAAIVGEVLALARGGIQLIGLDQGGRR